MKFDKRIESILSEDNKFLQKTIDAYIFNNKNVLKGDRDDNMFHNNMIKLDKKLIQLSKKEDNKQAIIDALKDEALFYPSTELKKLLNK